MDLDYGPQYDVFREEVRQFLNFTLDLAMGVDIGVTHLAMLQFP